MSVRADPNASPAPAGRAFTAVLRSPRALSVMLGAGALLVLGSALRLYRLDAPSLWFDEGGSLAASAGSSLWSVGRGLLETEHGDHFQPLYFMLLHVWRGVAGDGVFALRVPSALFGVATLVVLWLLALRLYGVAHSLWVLGLASTSAFLVGHAQEARPYAVLLLWGAVQLYVFVRLRQAREAGAGRGWLVAFWVVTGIGFFASLFLGLFGFVLAVADCVVFGRKGWLRTWIPAVAVGVPALVFFLGSRVATHPAQTMVTQRTGSLVRNAVYAVYGTLVGSDYGPPPELLHHGGALRTALDYWPQLAVAGLVVLGLAASFVFVWREQRREGTLSPWTRFLTLTLALSFVVACVFAAATKVNWQPRHSFYLALPLLLLLPLATGARSAGLRRTGQVLLAVLIALNGYSLSHFYWDARYEQDDYRAAAAYIRSQGPGTASVMLYGAEDLLRYYGDERTVEGDDLTKDDLAREVAARTGGAPEVLVVLNRGWAWDADADAVIRREMSEGYTLESTVTFPYFVIYRFRAVGSRAP